MSNINSVKLYKSNITFLIIGIILLFVNILNVDIWESYIVEVYHKMGVPDMRISSDVKKISKKIFFLEYYNLFTFYGIAFGNFIASLFFILLSILIYVVQFLIIKRKKVIKIKFIIFCDMSYLFFFLIIPYLSKCFAWGVYHNLYVWLIMFFILFRCVQYSFLFGTKYRSKNVDNADFRR